MRMACGGSWAKDQIHTTVQSHSSDNARSLIHWATRELPTPDFKLAFFFFLNKKHPRSHEFEKNIWISFYFLRVLEYLTYRSTHLSLGKLE